MRQNGTLYGGANIDTLIATCSCSCKNFSGNGSAAWCHSTKDPPNLLIHKASKQGTCKSSHKHINVWVNCVPCSLLVDKQVCAVLFSNNSAAWFAHLVSSFVEWVSYTILRKAEKYFEHAQRPMDHILSQLQVVLNWVLLLLILLLLLLLLLVLLGSGPILYWISMLCCFLYADNMQFISPATRPSSTMTLLPSSCRQQAKRCRWFDRSRTSGNLRAMGLHMSRVVKRLGDDKTESERSITSLQLPLTECQW